jgi:hypothetical protein
MSLVENSAVTTRRGGITGAGFMPGATGNPGGRPKGLARRVRELVGDDGHEIAEFMFSIMSDGAARTADRMEAARWLADRGFGKAIQAVDIEVAQGPWAELGKLSREDLETLLAIFRKYE